MVTWSKFHTKDPQILGATIKILYQGNLATRICVPLLEKVHVCAAYTTCKVQQFLFCPWKQQMETTETHLNLQFPYCVAIPVCQTHNRNNNITIACCGFMCSWFTVWKVCFTLGSTLLPQLCNHHNGGRVFSPNHCPKIRHCMGQRSLSRNISSLFSIIALETFNLNSVKLIYTYFHYILIE